MGVRDTSLCVQEEVGLLGHVGVSWGGEGRESKERAGVKGHKAPQYFNRAVQRALEGEERVGQRRLEK